MNLKEKIKSLKERMIYTSPAPIGSKEIPQEIKRYFEDLEKKLKDENIVIKIVPRINTITKEDYFEVWFERVDKYGVQSLKAKDKEKFDRIVEDFVRRFKNVKLYDEPFSYGFTRLGRYWIYFIKFQVVE